jgi:6-pyruvoyl-tetrahydropterin synthase
MTYGIGRYFNFQDVDGHLYVIKVELADDMIGENGYLKDYNDLDVVGDYLKTLDGTDLKESLGYVPTCELMAISLYRRFNEQFPQLVRVRVQERENAYGEYFR